MAELKFTEDNTTYEVTESFIIQLQDMPHDMALDVMKQLKVNASELPEENAWTQYVGGIHKAENKDVFFVIEFLRQEGESPVFVDFEYIDSDDYLDLYNQKQILLI